MTLVFSTAKRKSTSNMATPEEKERKLRRLKRNEAARSLRNFRPKRIPNKKKQEKYTPPQIELDDV